jgi:hypothetical protein
MSISFLNTTKVSIGVVLRRGVLEMCRNAFDGKAFPDVEKIKY